MTIAVITRAGNAIVVTPPGRSAIAVRPSASGTMRVSPAAQGPSGPSFGGFGSVDYKDIDTPAALYLPVGQWVRIVRNTIPSPANYAPLAGPWSGFEFWDGATLRARALGDVYLFKFAFAVTPFQIGSGLRFAVRPADDATFDFGPEPIVLSVDAGVSQTGSETFVEQVRTRFAASGAHIYVMSTTGGVLTSFSPEITPLSHV